eukprot:SAG22_NODE_4348_length_1295_cov_0.830268_2_plen_194_part_00
MAGPALRARLEELKRLKDEGLLPQPAWEQACMGAAHTHLGDCAGATPPTPSNVGAATAARRAAMAADPAAAARIELAAAYRIAAHCGLNEADQNHFTVMHPTLPATMLLIPQGTMWSQVRAGWLAEVSTTDHGAAMPTVQSLDGVVGVSDSAISSLDVEISAYVIHSPMHRARPDCNAVLHTHMPHATALASL